MNSHYKNLSTVTMGTIGEQKDQERLQKEILTTKDQEGKIDTEHWAFKQLVELMDNIGARANLELSKDEYEKFFNSALKKFKIDSPADLKTDAKKKEFFNYVDKNYKAKEEELDKEDTPTVKKVVKMLKKAVNANALKMSLVPIHDIQNINNCLAIVPFKYWDCVLLNSIVMYFDPIFISSIINPEKNLLSFKLYIFPTNHLTRSHILIIVK